MLIVIAFRDGTAVCNPVNDIDSRNAWKLFNW